MAVFSEACLESRHTQTFVHFILQIFIEYLLCAVVGDRAMNKWVCLPSGSFRFSPQIYTLAQGLRALGSTARHPQIHALTQPHTITLPYLSRGAQTPGPAPQARLETKRVREPLLRKCSRTTQLHWNSMHVPNTQHKFTHNAPKGLKSQKLGLGKK